MNTHGAVQTLQATVGLAGAGGTSTPTNPGDRLVCTGGGQSMWLPSLPVNTQAGAAYTLVLADAGKAVETTSAAAVEVTVPPNASVAFPVGAALAVTQVGAGALTVAAGAGVTLRTPS